jgi:hypothetical protein
MKRFAAPFMNKKLLIFDPESLHVLNCACRLTRRRNSKQYVSEAAKPHKATLKPDKATLGSILESNHQRKRGTLRRILDFACRQRA